MPGALCAGGWPPAAMQPKEAEVARCAVLDHSCGLGFVSPGLGRAAPLPCGGALQETSQPQAMAYGVQVETFCGADASPRPRRGWADGEGRALGKVLREHR